MCQKEVDRKLVADAERLAGRHAHKAHTLIHRYQGAAAYLSMAEFIATERELREFVIDRLAESYLRPPK